MCAEAFTVSDFCNMVESLIEGKHETWLKCTALSLVAFRRKLICAIDQCILRDNDCDQKLTKDECTQLVDDIVSRHKAILKDIISLHVRLSICATWTILNCNLRFNYRKLLSEASVKA